MKRTSNNTVTNTINNRGFSLIEIIIVIAIMVILAGGFTVIYTPYVEKARETRDLANVTHAITEVRMMAAGRISGSTEPYEKTFSLCQTKTGWTTNTENLYINGISFGDATWQGVPEQGGTCKVYYSDGQVNIDWGGTIDYTVIGNATKYALSTIQRKLAEDVNIYGRRNSTTTGTITLPNGKTINTIVYNRDYDYFQDIATRKVANTASAIYNRETGQITTIVYHDGRNYVEWRLQNGQWVEHRR